MTHHSHVWANGALVCNCGGARKPHASPTAPPGWPTVPSEPVCDILGPVDVALAVIDNPTDPFNKTWLLTVYMPAAQTVAAEVRRLQAERDTFYMDYRVKTDAQLKQAEAALAALRDQVCSNCKERGEMFSWRGGPGEDFCNLHDCRCVSLGHRCGLWTRRRP